MCRDAVEEGDLREHSRTLREIDAPCRISGDPELTDVALQVPVADRLVLPDEIQRDLETGNDSVIVDVRVRILDDDAKAVDVTDVLLADASTFATGSDPTCDWIEHKRMTA